MAQPPGEAEVGIPGVTRPKATKVKQPKIKYKYHEGEALLKTGLPLKGKFKYTEPKNEVPEYIFQEHDRNKKKSVALSMIDRMILRGAERGITAYPDSTVFQWIDEYKDLYRLVRDGKIKIFDNSRIVNEKYDYLTQYVLLGGRDSYDYKMIRRLGDLETLMEDRPYFMESAKATGRFRTKDFRVVIYLIDLFNDNKPMDKLKWEDMTLTLRNNKTLKGKGLIQPLDLRNEYVPSSNAFIHFHDGKNFKLYTHHDVKLVRVKGKAQRKGLYAISNKYFYGRPWQHEGQKYLVVKRITTNNSYFFTSRKYAGNDFVVLQEQQKGGSYIKPKNEAALRGIYFEQQQKVAKTEQ